MNKKLLMSIAVFCTMGLSAGAWATGTMTAGKIVAETREAAAEMKTNAGGILANHETVLRVAINTMGIETGPQYQGCYVWNGTQWIWVDPCPR